MNYRWTFKEKSDEETVLNLSKILKIPKTLALILANRGISSEIEAKDFFEPIASKILDPFLMNNMDLAVDRILKAVTSNEKIWIHGDYDVDGTTSTAILLHFFREIGVEVDIYIPDRYQFGHGLSETSINLAYENNVGLLITVDVGVTSVDAVEYANNKGINVIICDHHEPGNEIPNAYAIINPILPDCQFPFKYLAACGVVFKLLQAITIKMGIPEKAYEYLDFVALATIADMVPLIGENRVFVSEGLKLINHNPRPGFKGLLHCTRLKIGQINSTNIVFAIAPLINAAGRMGDAIRSVEMMVQNDENAAFTIAQQLEEENRRRRAFDYQTFEEAIEIAERQVKDGRRALVIHKSDWHPGVIGIVASRLVDRFNLPTILLTSIDNIAKGSARSCNNFDVHKALKKASHLMLEFGGHKHAAGLSMSEENVNELREIFEGLAKEQIDSDLLVPEIQIDSELKLNELSPNFFTILNKFSPFGYLNYKPVFYSKGVLSTNGVKIVGNNNIKFRAIQNNFVIDAIGYGLANKINLLSSGKPFSILYNLEINNFNGSNHPQLYIKDIKIE
ncbi:MAG: single-stranded-DNA-specific exonuclease RecJ [Candidatus Kapaibacteriota bacterium]